MGNISCHFYSETKWSTLACFRSRFGKVARDVIVDIPSFAEKKTVYCVAVNCNNIGSLSKLG